MHMIRVVNLSKEQLSQEILIIKWCILTPPILSQNRSIKIIALVNFVKDMLFI